MVKAAIGLGSNLGNREKQLHEAGNRLGVLGEVVGVSSIYVTEPIGPEQPDYLNMVMVIETDLSPDDLLARLLEIETTMGRKRKQRWGPRLIDLDLLLYGDRTVSQEGLRIPHPQMLERRFVLEPLLEVWPDVRLPDGTAVSDYLSAVEEQRVERVTTSTPVSRQEQPKGFRQKGGWWVVAQLVLFAGVIASVLFLNDVPGRFGPWSVIVGAALMIVAGVLAISAAWLLGGTTTPYPAPLPGGEFVDRGVYRLVRHPMYGGAILGFCGLALFRSSLPDLIFGLALIPFFRAKSGFEEDLLVANYGEYEAYRNRVKRRFIPWIF